MAAIGQLLPISNVRTQGEFRGVSGPRSNVIARLTGCSALTNKKERRPAAKSSERRSCTSEGPLVQLS
jgi:hypothetical protein